MALERTAVWDDGSAIWDLDSAIWDGVDIDATPAPGRTVHLLAGGRVVTVEAAGRVVYLLGESSECRP